MDHLDRLQQPTHERAPPPAPPGPLCFLVFVFPRPPAASGPPGRPLTVESKTLRLDECRYGISVLLRVKLVDKFVVIIY